MRLKRDHILKTKQKVSHSKIVEKTEHDDEEFIGGVLKIVPLYRAEHILSNKIPIFKLIELND